MGQDWVAAQAAQEAAIAAGGGGEAHQGLAIALFWQNDVDSALRAMERAYALFRCQGEHGRAAWAALWLAGQYSRLKGNGAEAGGWIAKCERAVSRAEPSAEIGRVILVRALATAGIEVRSIKDTTPIPHNGCRPPKRRRV